MRESEAPLNDDEIATQGKINRVYVNALCRQLAAEGLISRRPGRDGKLVSSPLAPALTAAESNGTTSASTTESRGPRQASLARQANRIQALIDGFSGWVTEFEASQAFPGPSLYFHERAIERQRQHQASSSLLADIRFLEYVYAMLPAWGMHRMGPQAAKVRDFSLISAALHEKIDVIDQLWPLHVTSLDADTARQVAAASWDVIAHIKVSASQTQIVAGSKFLHHVLPDLIPPIDRRYTFAFFTGQLSVPSDKAAFADWYPKLASIGMQCREPILEAISRGGFMASGEAKVIDNAIIGFMQSARHT